MFQRIGTRLPAIRRIRVLILFVGIHYLQAENIASLIPKRRPNRVLTDRSK
jgi:hypothetical protein